MKGVNVTRTDYVEIYHNIFEKHFNGITYDQLNKLEDKSIPTVGIHRSGITLGEMGIWAGALLRELGFMPVITPVSNEEIAQRGINIAPPQSFVSL